MLVTYLVVVMSTYGPNTINMVEVQPSKEVCEGAKKIHLELPRQTPAFSGTPDINKPILVKCETIEVPMELKP